MNKRKYRWGERIVEEILRTNSNIIRSVASARLSGAEADEMSLASWVKQELYNKMPANRREILFLIRDHPDCSFDFIHRHFMGLRPKTLHYHLIRLQVSGFIYKRGITRGAVYVANP
ncbi:hypothetical protein HYS82_02375 [Candidatus Amesbacteria bacterium]|nr:hypothetical protein [Candidatus Amesbacteria bacterium]